MGEADRPLARPSQNLQPRIMSRFQLSDRRPVSSLTTKRTSQVRALLPSGDALARPCNSLPRSSGPLQSLPSNSGDALPRPDIGSTFVASLNLPRMFPPKVTNQFHLEQGSSAMTPKSKPQRPLKKPRMSAAGHSGSIARTKLCSESILIHTLVPQFLAQFTIFSDILTRLQTSENGHSHFLRILDGFAPNTVFRYLTALLAFCETCAQQRIDLSTLDDVKLADLLMTKASEMGKFSNMTLKSIRWAWKQFQLSCFKDCFSPVVSSFSKIQFHNERKESLPLPLLILVQWERRILQSASTTLEVLTLGTFLLMAFSSMRYGDLQRILTSKLQYDGKTLRGVAWKTKTCNSGVPFGIVCRGFLSKGSYHWVHKFLICLDSTLQGTDPAQVDFILPSFTNGEVGMPLAAMPYPEALFYLRSFMLLPWRSAPIKFDNVMHYTIHSLKSTFLSWASQLRIEPELRRLQGHHQDPLRSTRLYSRDDIDGSIFVQESIVSKVLEGWRPHTPLSRGGQIPLQEPAVLLESFRKEAPEQSWQFFQFGVAPQILVFPENDAPKPISESSSESSSDSSSSEESHTSRKASITHPEFSLVDEIDMGFYRNTLHVILDWGMKNPTEQDSRVRTACGRLFPAGNVTRHSEVSAPPGKAFCAHPGCKKGWQAIGASL